MDRSTGIHYVLLLPTAPTTGVPISTACEQHRLQPTLNRILVTKTLNITR